MSSLIETVETFYLRTLTEQSYSDKIDGLLNSFPEYDCFRSVLPEKNPKTADDYISMKFCTIGRFPVFGIYHKRDIQLIAICVEGTLFAIDDCDFDPKFVPHLQVENVYLGIQNSPLAVSEGVSYTKATMCSAISTLSLGYTQEKKNEWTSAIVLLMGMTTQAVRFYSMKDHVAQGLTIKGDARHIPHLRDLRLQNRWGEISKAVRRQKYPYIFNYCDNKNVFFTDSMLKYCIGYTVALINDIDGSKREKFSRKNNEWNGQREGSKGKHSKEENKKRTKDRWSPQLMEPHKVTIEESLLRTTLLIRANKSRVSATAAASSLRGTSKIFKVDASGSFLWFKMPHTSSLDPYRTSAECSRPLFTATAFSMHAERHKVSTSIKDLCGFNQFRISKEKDKQGSRPFVQVGCGTISGAVGATCVYALQVIRTRMQAEGLFVNLLKVVPSARAATKLIAMKTWTKCLLSKK